MGIILQFILRLLASLPLRVLYGLGRFVSWLAEKVIRYRVNDVMINLSRSFPELKYREIKDLKHKFYIHFGEFMAESIWFGGCRNPGRLVKRRLVEVDNPEELQRLYDKSPDVMILMSHAGNWELIGGICLYNYGDRPWPVTEQNCVVVYRKQKSPFWNRFLHGNRTAPLTDRKGFQGYVESLEVMRYALSHRGEKKFYNFITDQYPYFKAPDYQQVEFMHQRTITMKGAAVLAHKTGMAVCYMGMPSESRGHYKLCYKTICDDASAMQPEDIMNQYYRLLEEDLKAQPWNYLWTHRRWK